MIYESMQWNVVFIGFQNIPRNQIQHSKLTGSAVLNAELWVSPMNLMNIMESVLATSALSPVQFTPNKVLSLQA
jgi:hypothetical protein